VLLPPTVPAESAGTVASHRGFVVPMLLDITNRPIVVAMRTILPVVHLLIDGEEPG
jgi:hypothetical protein